MKLVILMSGGLDSYISYYYARAHGINSIMPLWFDINQPYKYKEQAAIEAFDFPVTKMHLDLIRPEFDNIPTIHNQIIPGRNMIFATIAASFGNLIWMCALEGEMHKYMVDKNDTFFSLASGVLSYTFDKKVSIETPFSKLTKTEIVKWALKNGLTKEQLSKTSTCYHPTEQFCGECGTCFKRNIAMSLNGIHEPYKVNPFESAWGVDYMKKIVKAIAHKDYTHYSKNRLTETFAAFELYKKS